MPWRNSNDGSLSNGVTKHTPDIKSLSMTLWIKLPPDNASSLFMLHFHILLHICGLCCRNRYHRPGQVITSHSKLRDVITYPCLRYLLLATKSSFSICIYCSGFVCVNFIYDFSVTIYHLGLYSLNGNTPYHQGPLLLTWFNFNPSMDKQLHPL